jgi:lipopolysaccharide heptosyltransferase II
LGKYRYTRLRWRVLFALIDAVGGLLFRLCRVFHSGLRHIAGGEVLSIGRSVEKEPRVILLVQLDHLGDAVISSVMLPALRARYPQASIEVLSGGWNRELFEAMPEVDRVYVSRVNRFARGKRWTGVLAVLSTLWWGWRLRRRGVDLAIDVRGEFPLALMLWLSGARRRLGWACGGGGFLLTDSPRYVPGRPEVQSRLALLATLGIRPVEDPQPAFAPTEPERSLALQWWSYLNEKWPTPGPKIVIHLGAGTAAKRWPSRYWQDLIGWLVLRLQAQVVLVGTAAERIIAHEILGVEPCERVSDWTGRLSLTELAAVLEQADLMVGADSGPAHLAAAVGTPVVTLFSGTNRAGQWRPRARQVKVLWHRVPCSPCHREQCPRADHPCMAGLRPERVAEVIASSLSPRRRKGVRP